MSLICRVVIGYFDAHANCTQPSITLTRSVDEEDVACLQVACDEAFDIQKELSNHLTREGVLCIQDVVVRPDTYTVAAVAHGLLGMSVIDHARRSVLFPTEAEPFPEPEQLLNFYRLVHPDMNEQQLQQLAKENLRGRREQREFRRGVRERVRWFVAAWRNRIQRNWLTPTVLALAHLASEERQFDVLPVLADALEEAGCTDQTILAHLRGPGAHLRGCWAVDILLRKD
jgi:hypothetical protein